MIGAGKLLILFGLGLVILGSLMVYAPGLINGFGRLPGDIRIEGEHSRIFIPITSMILVSLALTLVVNLFFWR